MNIHELIHAWERNVLPENSEALQDAIKTVEEHEAEVSKWEAEAISTPVKALYNFPLGICAHLKNDIMLLSAVVKASEDMIIIDGEETKGGEPS